MTGIGYKELYLYFDGDISLDESIELIKKNSRHLAKRQYFFTSENVKGFFCSSCCVFCYPLTVMQLGCTKRKVLDMCLISRVRIYE